ncbi:hypothetical protein Q75_12325 [Bacillus coahuilensis p1.1.43]|uniref:AB hydrolase-1 domain-containing protein n=1 Tax=Bacillus coahuilensis p1.1.43 TaxID=1150625 RepID=A0A147K652_9BACI|nr:alpha/beta hydrolase [Bacillus coahuilensis]KUP05312.1 hypothetical protein Q75_12325 [Bacillus coahuilensis p1.1.43]
MPITLLENSQTTYYDYIVSEQKDAETFLFIHGLGCDSTLWDDIMPFLKPKYNLVVFDLPGHGRNKLSENVGFSLSLIFSDIEHILFTENIPSCHVVGYAGGGNIALEAVLKQKKWVRSLTLISTPIFMPFQIGDQEMRKRFAKIEEGKKQQVFKSIIDGITVIASEERKSRLEGMMNRVDIRSYKDFYKVCKNSIQEYSPEKFKNVDLPIFLLVGEFDATFPPKLHLFDDTYLNSSRFLIIPNAGNAVMVDTPKQLVELLDDFVIQYVLGSPPSLKGRGYVDKLKFELQSIVNLGIRQVNSRNTIELHFLSSFKVLLDGKEIEGKWNQRKAKQIFSYILYHQQVTRDQLYDVFWPDLELTKARNQLRVSLNHIKSIIEGFTGDDLSKYIDIGRDLIVTSVRVKSDGENLLNEIEQLKLVSYSDRAAKVVELIARLPEVMFPGLYDEWVLELRSSIEMELTSIIEDLLDEDLDRSKEISMLKYLIKIHPNEELYYEQILFALEQERKYSEMDFYEDKLNSLK